MEANYIIHLLKSGKRLRSFPLKEGQTIEVGREEDCTILLEEAEKSISRRHMTIVMGTESVLIRDSSTNGVFRNGKRIPKGKLTPIRPGESIRLANGPYFLELEVEHTPEAPTAPLDQGVWPAGKRPKVVIGDAPTPPSKPNPQPPKEVRTQKIPDNFVPPQPSGRKRIVIRDPSVPAPKSTTAAHQFMEILNRRGEVKIGRDPSCDIVLNSLMVSRHHALVKKTGSGAIVYDTHSTNGVFVDGRRIKDSQPITSQNTVTIGAFSFSLRGEIVDFLDSGKPAIVARNIKKVYGEKFTALKETSLEIPSRAVVALMGPSGCGKSTLLKCLNGDNPPTTGTVMIQGLILNQKDNFNLLKRHIGYVPQDDIVHGNLTVDQTMYYAAKLRLAKDVTELEIANRITKVLSDLNINNSELRGKLVKELSGGQRKRVSIAVEILNEPSILFLDEPTSPLDPETIDDFLVCLRKLSKDGTTIVMVTHKPSDLEYVDRVIFLSTGGYLTYFGKPGNIYRHFELPTKNIVKIYSLLSKEDEGIRWYNQWRQTNYANDTGNGAIHEPLEPPAPDNPLRQLFWLSRRYLHLKWNDKGNMALLAAQPLIISLLVVYIFGQLQLGVLFLMAISAIWFGVSNAAKEIVDEQAIYKRERMYNLSITNYLLSKITVLTLIAFAQVILFVSVLYIAYATVSERDVLLRSYWSNVWFMLYLAFSATLLGLMISSLFKNTEKVMTLVPIVLMPQIMLAGVLASIDNKIKEVVSYLTLGRWGTEGFSRIQDEKTMDLGEGIGFEVITTPAGTKTSVHSIIVQVQRPQQDGTLLLEDTSSKAMDVLNFYDPDTHLMWFDGTGLNMLAISILNVIVLGVIYFTMKRKDSI